MIKILLLFILLLQTFILELFQIVRMKQRRRTLKNRGYAARYNTHLFDECSTLCKVELFLYSCRIKRIEQKDELEQEKVGELSETEKLAEDNGKIREEIEALHRKYEALQKFALQKKIPLPSEMDPLH